MMEGYKRHIMTPSKEPPCLLLVIIFISTSPSFISRLVFKVQYHVKKTLEGSAQFFATSLWTFFRRIQSRTRTRAESQVFDRIWGVLIKVLINNVKNIVCHPIKKILWLTSNNRTSTVLCCCSSPSRGHFRQILEKWIGISPLHAKLRGFSIFSDSCKSQIHSGQKNWKWSTAVYAYQCKSCHTGLVIWDCFRE